MTTRSLRDRYAPPPMPAPLLEDRDRHIQLIVGAAMRAADPAAAVEGAWLAEPPIAPETSWALLSVGKASPAMAAGALRAAQSRPAFGLVIGPVGLTLERAIAVAGIDVLESDHPLPTERSVDAGQAALDVAERCRREGVPLVVLISGGASSLMCVPEAGLSIDDLRTCTAALLKAGASIEELNAVRAHCDLVKGGRLAAAAAPATVATLVLSDVIGDQLDIIGSGPTVASTASAKDALAVLKRRKVERACRAAASHLRLRIAKPLDAPDCSHAECRVIANNSTAVDAAAACAQELGFEVGESRSGITGEARDAAFGLVGAIRRVRAGAGGRPAAVIWGGETTVTVKGKGRGGRNLEAALAVAIAIDGDATLVAATFATDGIDGGSDAAGAVVDGRTAAMARRAGVDPEAHLADSDSHGFFERCGGGAFLRPGPTGTNVNDLWIALAY